MTSTAYTVVEIYTSEEVRWKGFPLYEAIVQTVARERIAARCLVTRAVAGCYEDGALASHRVLDLSHNMPVKVEIVLPEPELERILEHLREMVSDGVVLAQNREVLFHRTTGGLIPRGLMVRDIMTTAPVTVRPDMPVSAAVDVLVRAEFDGVPVVDEAGRLQGMVELRDLVAKAHISLDAARVAAIWRGDESGASSAELLRDGLSLLRVGEVMTGGQATVHPETAVAEAAKTMTAIRSKRLPVVDEERHLLGMVARIDILRLASGSSSRRQTLAGYGVLVPPTCPVSDTTLLQVPAVAPETPATEVIDLIDDIGQRVVVVGPEGAPLGVISDRDLLPLLQMRERHRTDLSAADIMRTDVPVLGLEVSVEQALDLMVAGPYKRLPVVDERGVYVGMLSREELLRVIVSDAANAAL